MDFHAVVDATALAPRSSFVRIATGRDATVIDGGLPDDDLGRLVVLG